MKILLKVISCILFFTNSFGLKIDRAIVSSNTNPTYLDFWPIAAKGWLRLGIRPTLALICDGEAEVDETLGDVIRFEPIPGVSNALYAQAIRLLLPILFEDEVSIVSDIDMIPISPNYFIHSIESIPEELFVMFRYNAYPKKVQIYPMCYNAGKGYLFREIFGIDKIEDIPLLIKEWSDKKIGWCTDEHMLYLYLNNWDGFNSRCAKLSTTVKRIGGEKLRFDKNLLTQHDYYVDCHCHPARPYKKYKKIIDNLAHQIEIY